MSGDDTLHELCNNGELEALKKFMKNNRDHDYNTYEVFIFFSIFSMAKTILNTDYLLLQNVS